MGLKDKAVTWWTEGWPPCPAEMHHEKSLAWKHCDYLEITTVVWDKIPVEGKALGDQLQDAYDHYGTNGNERGCEGEEIGALTGQ